MKNAGKRKWLQRSGRVILVGVSLVFFLGWLIFPESVRTFRNAAAQYLNLAPEPQVHALSNLLAADQSFASIGRGDTIGLMGSAWAGDEFSAAPQACVGAVGCNGESPFGGRLLRTASGESKSTWPMSVERGVRVPSPAVLLSVALLIVGLALLDQLWSRAAAFGRSLDLPTRLRAAVRHFAVRLRARIEPAHGLVSIARLAPARASVASLLALGFFIGWLTAPDFIRRQESSVAESLAISSAEPSPMLNQFASWLGAAGAGSIGRGGSRGDSTATTLTDSMPQPLALDIVNWESDEEEGSSTDLQMADFDTSAGHVSTGPRANHAVSRPSGDSPSLADDPDWSEVDRYAFLTPAGFGGSSAGGAAGGSEGPSSFVSGPSAPGRDGGVGGSESPIAPQPPPDSGNDPKTPAGGCASSDLLCILQAQVTGLLTVPDQALVLFAPGATNEEIASALAPSGGRIVECFDVNKYCLVEMPGEPDLAGAILGLRGNPAILNAEPNYVLKPAESALDVLYPIQWSLGKIQVSNAWSEIPGNKSHVKVAVLDTGFDILHPDLVNVWTETYNAVDGSSIVVGNPMHGTMVAGILAALGDNVYGIAGTNKKWADLALVKVFDDLNNSNDALVIKGIDHLPAGTRVANLSLSGLETGSPPYALCTAIHNRSDVLFVAAAGNRGLSVPDYPAACGGANVIAVASTDSSDQLGPDSNRGPTVDLAAPGESILTTAPLSTFAFASGTSMAAPHVAGVASMLFAKNGTATVASVKNTIRSSVDYLHLSVSTGGRLNACRALGACQ